MPTPEGMVKMTIYVEAPFAEWLRKTSRSKRIPLGRLLHQLCGHWIISTHSLDEVGMPVTRTPGRPKRADPAPPAATGEDGDQPTEPL